MQLFCYSSRVIHKKLRQPFTTQLYSTYSLYSCGIHEVEEPRLPPAPLSLCGWALKETALQYGNRARPSGTRRANGTTPRFTLLRKGLTIAHAADAMSSPPHPTTLPCPEFYRMFLELTALLPAHTAHCAYATVGGHENVQGAKFHEEPTRLRTDETRQQAPPCFKQHAEFGPLAFLSRIRQEHAAGAWIRTSKEVAPLTSRDDARPLRSEPHDVRHEHACMWHVRATACPCGCRVQRCSRGFDVGSGR